MIPLKYIISLLKKSCRIQQIVLLDEISNIMRSIPLRFRVECLWNILFKKCGISNQPVAASAMIRVFPSLEHSDGACPHSGRQFVGLLCVSLIGTRQQLA